MLHMMEVVVPLHIHVEKMKEIVILAIIAKVVLIVAQIIAQLDSTSLLMLTVALNLCLILLFTLIYLDLKFLVSHCPKIYILLFRYQIF